MAQALRTAVVRKPGNAQLHGDLEDLAVIGPAGVAAGRADQLRVPGDLGDAAQLGRHPVPMYLDDLRRGWHRRARQAIQDQGVLAPGPGSILPPPLAFRDLEGTLDRGQVERSGRFHHILGELRGRQACGAFGRCSGRRRELEPALALACQPAGAGETPAFRLEDQDGRLGQVGRPPGDALDDDPLATVCAALRRHGWRLEQDGAVGARGGGSRGGWRRLPPCLRWPRDRRAASRSDAGPTDLRTRIHAHGVADGGRRLRSARWLGSGGGNPRHGSRAPRERHRRSDGVACDGCSDCLVGACHHADQVRLRPGRLCHDINEIGLPVDHDGRARRTGPERRIQRRRLEVLVRLGRRVCLECVVRLGRRIRGRYVRVGRRSLEAKEIGEPRGDAHLGGLELRLVDRRSGSP